MAAEGSGHVVIGPVGAVSINLQQDMGMLDLIGRRLPGLGQVDEFLSFVVCESHDVFFVHADSSIPHEAVSQRYRHKSTTAKDKDDQVLALFRLGSIELF